MARSPDFKTPECRLSYASSLYKPRAQSEGGEPKYGCTLIFPKTARVELEKQVLAAIVEEWGPDKGPQMAKAGLIKSPFLAGDGKEARNKKTGEIHPGMGADVFFIRVSSNKDRPPAVRWKDPNTQETEQNVYSGCYGKAVINAYTWDHPANGKGVSFGVHMFQKLRDGERLGGSGGVDTDKYFETVEDSGDAPESTRNGDGAAGLFGN